MHILVINNDGMTVSGITALHNALADHVDCVTIAPDRDKSGASSPLTLDRPPRPQRLDNRFISPSGTPTDCVHLSLNGLLEGLPDMVVSSTSLGANLGNDVLYSGTVAAAIEGRFLKGLAFAFSLVSRLTDNLPTAICFARLLVSAYERLAVPPRTALNTNIPSLPLDCVRGIQLTCLGHRVCTVTPVKVINPHDKEGYWITTAGDARDGGPGTGFRAVTQGYVSITPLQLGRIFHGAFGGLSE